MEKNKVFLYILYGVLVIVLAYAIYATKGFGLWKESGSSTKGEYQAVFLANGQVYFGKLKNQNSQFSTLSDIYYLQVDNNSQIQPDNNTTSSSGKLTLIKLGNEVHGPQDEMTINRDQVLFVENLKDDGKVAQAIKKFQESGSTTGEVQTSTSPAATKK